MVVTNGRGKTAAKSHGTQAHEKVAAPQTQHRPVRVQPLSHQPVSGRDRARRRRARPRGGPVLLGPTMPHYAHLVIARRLPLPAKRPEAMTKLSPAMPCGGHSTGMGPSGSCRASRGYPSPRTTSTPYAPPRRCAPDKGSHLHCPRRAGHARQRPGHALWRGDKGAEPGRHQEPETLPQEFLLQAGPR